MDGILKMGVAVALVFLIVGMMASCADRLNPKQADILNASFYYVQDPEAQLCFAVLRFGGSITMAPCACNEVPQEYLLDIRRVKK